MQDMLFPIMAEEGRRAPQYMAALAANMASMTAGSIFGWSSPTLPKLKDPDSYLVVTDSEASWIGSLMQMGAVLGPFASLYLVERLGRKWTLLSLGVPFLLSWVLITAANSVGMIYAGRLIGGLGVGTVFAVAPMYVGEIAEDSIRGSLCTLLNPMLCFGILYADIIGPYVPYIWLGIASILILCVFILTFSFMPESPYFLLAKGKKEEANKSLQWLRGKSKEDVTEELLKMQEFVEESNERSGSFKEVFTVGANRKALFFSWSLIAFQQLCGFGSVLLYTTDIFKLAGGSLPDEVCTIIVGVILVLSSFCTPLLVERLGRKMLLYISASGMALSEFILGLYFYLKTETTTDLSSLGWLPVMCVAVFVPHFSLGYGPIPYAMIGELFSPSIKSLASALTASFGSIVGFLVTKFFQDIISTLGIYSAFWIYGGCCAISIVFVYFALPETRGKSLQEIQQILKNK